jgi:hypothetical protein
VIHPKHCRLTFLIALVAIACAIVLMLIPHAQAADQGPVFAILPVLFIGLIAPLNLLSWLVFSRVVLTPDATVRPASFQRPPPFHLG